MRKTLVLLLLVLCAAACGRPSSGPWLIPAPPAHHRDDPGPPDHADDAGHEGDPDRAGGAGRDPPAPDAHRCRTPAPPCAALTVATVERVIDGDTVILRTGLVRARVRLIGVDAPETWLRHDCFGEEAAKALRRLLPPGSTVRDTGDTEPRDRYGRLLLYLWSPRSAFVNASLIRRGFARAMPIPPNTRYASVLEEAEHAARHTRTGLWRACQ